MISLATGIFSSVMHAASHLVFEGYRREWHLTDWVPTCTVLWWGVQWRRINGC